MQVKSVEIFCCKDEWVLIGKARECSYSRTNMTIELCDVIFNEKIDNTWLGGCKVCVTILEDDGFNPLCISIFGVDLTGVKTHVYENFKTTYTTEIVGKSVSNDNHKKKESDKSITVEKPITVVDVIEELLEQRRGNGKRAWNIQILDEFQDDAK